MPPPWELFPGQYKHATEYAKGFILVNLKLYTDANTPLQLVALWDKIDVLLRIIVGT